MGDAPWRCCPLHANFAFGVDQVGRAQVGGHLASRGN
jgi:hypothetical protein